MMKSRKGDPGADTQDTGISLEKLFDKFENLEEKMAMIDRI